MPTRLLDSSALAFFLPGSKQGQPEWCTEAALRDSEKSKLINISIMLSGARVSIGKIWKWNSVLLSKQQERWARLKIGPGNPADLFYIFWETRHKQTCTVTFRDANVFRRYRDRIFDSLQLQFDLPAHTRSNTSVTQSHNDHVQQHARVGLGSIYVKAIRHEKIHEIPVSQSVSSEIKDNPNISLLRRPETYRGADIPPHYDHNRINSSIPAKTDPLAPEYLKLNLSGGLFATLYQCNGQICLEERAYRLGGRFVVFFLRSLWSFNWKWKSRRLDLHPIYFVPCKKMQIQGFAADFFMTSGFLLPPSFQEIALNRSNVFFGMQFNQEKKSKHTKRYLFFWRPRVIISRQLCDISN